MGKFAAIKGSDVIHSDKFAKPEDFNVGSFAKRVADEVGPMIKVTGIQQMRDIMINKSGKGKKWDRCEVWLGLCKADLVITGKAKNGEQDTVTVHRNFATLIENQQDARLINADPGDDKIDRSATTMSRAKTLEIDTQATADLSTVKGDVIILAHGGSRGSSPGKVYCNNFANKNVAEIVRYLSETKPLPLAYKGTVYLDGCFTAAGSSGGTDIGDLNNFAAKVYKALAGKGYKYLQVKGNLGVASTLTSGAENVVPAQANAALEKELANRKSDINKITKKYNDAQALFKQHQAVYTKLKKAKPLLETQIKEAADQPTKVKLEAKMDILENKLEDAKVKMLKSAENGNKWHETLNAIKHVLAQKGASKKQIIDLVGTFGPEKLPDSA